MDRCWINKEEVGIDVMNTFNKLIKYLIIVSLAVICLVLITGCSGPTASTTTIDEPLATGQPVLAEFGRGTCIPCKEMKPILEELSKEYDGRLKVLILSIDDYRYLTNQYRITAIPTQVILDSTGKEVYRHIGFWSKSEIVAQLDKLGIK
jgi:thioredoxin 1